MNALGYSLYMSSFEEQKAMFEKLEAKEAFVFTSFHIQEEMEDLENYVQTTREINKWMKKRGFRIIGDVSPKTLKAFNTTTLFEFAQMIQLDLLRLDYGFEKEEILEIAKAYPICFNASTVDPELVKEIQSIGTEVYGCHNFYPRPETGLDDQLFQPINATLHALGIPIIAFIPGDLSKRGPIHEGLPTLEKHRDLLPYVALVELIQTYKVDTVLVGDLSLTTQQQELMSNYLSTGVISLPVVFEEKYKDLYNQTYTIRVDSPYTNMRLQ